LNYDATTIPDGYNKARDHGPEFLELWMNTLDAWMAGLHVRDILDLGCGTGRFSQALAARFKARVIGFDPSTKMLSQARDRRSEATVYANATAESLPLHADSVDVVFLSMVFHHFTDRARAAAECHRVLRKGGRVFLRTASSDRISSYPYVPFFPTSRSVLEQRLPSIAVQSEVFQSAGLDRIATTLVVQQIAENYAAYADKLAAGGDSVLASLAPAEFAAGLRSLREAEVGMSAAVVEPIDLLIFEKRA
jgi:ubiquinone/menaquinone biosynthesis C-methylase UbiE